LSEKFLVGVLCRALERRIKFVSPDALEIGLAPRSFQRLGWCRCTNGSRNLRRCVGIGQRNDGADGGRGNGDRNRRARGPVTHDASTFPLFRASLWQLLIEPYTKFTRVEKAHDGRNCADVWGERRGHGTIRAVQLLPMEFPHVAQLSV